MLHVLIVPDKFKDSLSAEEAIEAIRKGVEDFDPSAKTFSVVASDGGDGFLEAVHHYQPYLSTIQTETIDPLKRPIKAEYLWDETTNTAYIELAKASGIELLLLEERNVMKTTTIGTGIQIKDAINRGAKTIYVGLGGSATNDAATGIASVLGYRFYDDDNKEIAPCGEHLDRITYIKEDTSLFDQVKIVAINDVQNPLHGPNGAAYTYARQKGANDDQIEELDQGLRHLDKVMKEQFGRDHAALKGSGAAGGTGYGLKTFLNAEFISGTSFILGLSNFHEILQTHRIDCIITGEGKIDQQTAYGKLINGVVSEGKKRNIPVFGICGKLDLNAAQLKALGLMDAREIHDPTKPVSYSYEHTARLIREQVTHLLREWTGKG